MKITEGTMPFRGFQTYYRIVGDLNHTLPPLVLLHGGPGSTHNYFELFDHLAEEEGRALVMYDQIGCGESFVEGHPELFNGETWLEELSELRKHLKLEQIHLLGQSWGGMLAIWYACECSPQGVLSYILSSTHASSKLWEEEQRRRIRFMDPADQAAISQAEASGDYKDPAYLRALARFMERHCDAVLPEDAPECLTRPKKQGTESYVVGWGPNEFTPTGNLRNFEFADRLHHIQEPCLIINGQRDLSSPYISKMIYDRIPRARWELFQYSAHMPYVEEHEKYVEILKEWMREHDPAKP